jgi:hypothetical protein
MLFLPPINVQSLERACKIQSVPVVLLAGCTCRRAGFIRPFLTGCAHCKGGVGLHETAELPPFQPTEEEAAGDGLTLGENPSHTLSHSCRTLSTGHNAVDLYRHHASDWRFDREAHDVRERVSSIHIRC